MADVPKVSLVDASLQESAYRHADKQKKQQDEQTAEVEQPKSFSDIYDSTLNNNASIIAEEFQLKNEYEASEKLYDVVSEMNNISTDDFIINYPTESIIELSILANNKNQG